MRASPSPSRTWAKKKIAVPRDGEGFKDLSVGVFTETDDEVFAFIDPGIKARVVDIASIQHPGIPFIQEG